MCVTSFLMSEMTIQNLTICSMWPIDDTTETNISFPKHPRLKSRHSPISCEDLVNIEIGIQFFMINLLYKIPDCPYFRGVVPIFLPDLKILFEQSPI